MRNFRTAVRRLPSNTPVADSSAGAGADVTCSCVIAVLFRAPRLCGRTWVDNIRMDLQEVGCGYMDWIVLAQDRDR